MKVFGDGNLRLAVSGDLQTFSPACLVTCRPAEARKLDVAERAREHKGAGTWRQWLWAAGPPQAAVTLGLSPQAP